MIQKIKKLNSKRKMRQNRMKIIYFPIKCSIGLQNERIQLALALGLE